MWPLAPASILWLLAPLAIGLVTGWAAWRGRGSVFQVRRHRRRHRTLYWRATEPRLPGEPAPPLPVAEWRKRVPTASAEEDDLTLIRGVGPSQARALRALGVTRFARIAAWTPAQAEYYGARLGDFGRRIVQDRWCEQARLLAEGDLAGFAARFGAAERVVA